jgi:hypothetical protein
MSIGPPYSQPFENGLRLVIRRTTTGFLRGAFVAEAPQVQDSARPQEGVAAERAAALQMKVRIPLRLRGAPAAPREQRSHFRKFRHPIRPCSLSIARVDAPFRLNMNDLNRSTKVDGIQTPRTGRSCMCSRSARGGAQHQVPDDIHNMRGIARIYLCGVEVERVRAVCGGRDLIEKLLPGKPLDELTVCGVPTPPRLGKPSRLCQLGPTSGVAS